MKYLTYKKSFNGYLYEFHIKGIGETEEDAMADAQITQEDLLSLGENESIDVIHCTDKAYEKLRKNDYEHLKFFDVFDWVSSAKEEYICLKEERLDV